MLTSEQLADVKTSLFAGQYNLLLGSGISLDSFDKDHVPIVGATELTNFLCGLKNARPGTSLSRVSLLLTPAETEQYLTKKYSSCRPGETVHKLTNFLWKTAFTFNIDDALEAAYEKNRHAKQEINSLNYDTTYETPSNRSQLSIVHLHGYTRESEKGYVFSVAEYGRVTRGLNPWMHVLSELLASEPFIISGTSLNESDLEYYLSGRTETSPRKNRGPSILVEPFPDAVTISDCTRHGLILVQSTLKEFLIWLTEQLGNPPTAVQLVSPAVENIFRPSPPPIDKVEFFTSFHLVKPVAPNASELSPFLYGQLPTWSDLESSLDIPTVSERRLGSKARSFLEAEGNDRAIFCMLADPGAGKSTNIRRVAYDLSKEGKIVLFLTNRMALDVKTIVSCLALITRPFALVIDGIADHASSLRSIFTDVKITQRFVVVCADRQYRGDHIERLLGDLPIEYLDIKSWPVESNVQLIEKYRKTGLVGSTDAIRHPEKFAYKLANDSVSINTCRILNSFKPLESIIKSLWNDATIPERLSYITAALAEHCYSGGLLYPVLEIAQKNPKLNDQISYECPLPLAFSEDDDYILPLNSIVADRTLQLISREKKDSLLQVFIKLGSALAPYVNRRTVINQTPEARLAGRLFNAEQVVRPFLGELAEQFYKETQESWQWNSRYWEQRALLTQGTNIDLAVQYARHAVAIESHPFPWTTLASILVKKLELTPQQRDPLFKEALELLDNVFKYEEQRDWRSTPHPYAALFHAVNAYMDQQGRLMPKQQDFVRKQIEKCTRTFARDKNIQSSATTLLLKIK